MEFQREEGEGKKCVVRIICAAAAEDGGMWPLGSAPCLNIRLSSGRKQPCSPFVYPPCLPIPSPVSFQTCCAGTGDFLARFGLGCVIQAFLPPLRRAAQLRALALCVGCDPPAWLSGVFGGGKAHLCPAGKGAACTALLPQPAALIQAVLSCSVPSPLRSPEPFPVQRQWEHTGEILSDSPI